MMAFPDDLPPLAPALTPLAWLVGHWQGVGVYGYPTTESGHFGQELVVWHDGRQFLQMHSRSWLLDEQGQTIRPSATEVGVWRVLDDGEVELLLTHPTGIMELYVGRPDPERASIEMRTDTVVRSPAAKEYNAGHRLYGVVDAQLMWVMDMAAVGHPMHSHLSAKLKPRDQAPPAPWVS